MQLSYGRRSISGPRLLNTLQMLYRNYKRAEIMKKTNTNNKQVKLAHLEKNANWFRNASDIATRQDKEMKVKRK